MKRVKEETGEQTAPECLEESEDNGAPALTPLGRTTGPLYTAEAYKKPPIPLDPDVLDPLPNRKWIPDFGDEVLPRRKGFLTDFVFATRGVMTPTISCIWTCFYTLESAIKREAWLKWYPNTLFANQYIIIVGPAGVGKKTTAAVYFALPLLRAFRNYMTDRNIYEMKHIEILKDKATPEAMLSAMLPQSRPGGDYFIQNPDGSLAMDAKGKAIPVRRTSELAILVSELSTILSNNSYSKDTTGTLLDIYDCHDDWEWRTEKRGTKVLKWLYTTFLAGSTVDGLRDSIPRAAKGDGFLSRCVMVYVPHSNRSYPEPFQPKGAPDITELAKRLAWVVEHTLGEFQFTWEAKETFNRWYASFTKRLNDFPEFGGSISRMDVNVRKVALLMRAQRYDATGPEIDREDVMDAIKIVEATYKSLPFLMSQLSEDTILRNTDITAAYIKAKGVVTRKTLLTATRLRSDVSDMVISELISRGLVDLVEGKAGTYKWVGGDNDRGREAGELWSSTGFTDTETLRINSESSQRAKSDARVAAKVAKKKQSGSTRKVSGAE